MNINLTLIGQSVSFLFFVWFCWKVVWPKFASILDQRQLAIEEGIRSAEQGVLKRMEAEQAAETTTQEAKDKAKEIITFAKSNASHIEEQAKQKANEESKRIIDAAKQESDALRTRLKEELTDEVGELAVLIAERIITDKVDKKLHDKLISDMAKQL